MFSTVPLPCSEALFVEQGLKEGYRSDGRAPLDLRPVALCPNIIRKATGSVSYKVNGAIDIIASISVKLGSPSFEVHTTLSQAVLNEGIKYGELRESLNQISSHVDSENLQIYDSDSPTFYYFEKDDGVSEIVLSKAHDLIKKTSPQDIGPNDVTEEWASSALLKKLTNETSCDLDGSALDELSETLLQDMIASFPSGLVSNPTKRYTPSPDCKITSHGNFAGSDTELDTYSESKKPDQSYNIKDRIQPIQNEHIHNINHDNIDKTNLEENCTNIKINLIDSSQNIQERISLESLKLYERDPKIFIPLNAGDKSHTSGIQLWADIYVGRCDGNVLEHLFRAVLGALAYSTLPHIAECPTLLRHGVRLVHPSPGSTPVNISLIPCEYTAAVVNGIVYLDLTDIEARVIKNMSGSVACLYRVLVKGDSILSVTSKGILDKEWSNSAIQAIMKIHNETIEKLRFCNSEWHRKQLDEMISNV